jgi:fructosamine-3-kinase
MNEDYFEQESFQVSKIILKNVFGEIAKKMYLKKMTLRPRSIVFFVVKKNKISHALKLNKFSGYANGTSVCFNQWKAVGVPVVDLVSYGSLNGYDFTLTKYIDTPEGNLINYTDAKRSKLAFDMGRCLAKIHTCVADGYGFINENGTGKDTSWIDFLNHRFLDPIESLVTRGLLDKDYLVKTQKIIKEFSNRSFLPVYLHTDYYAHNVFIKQNGNLRSIADPNPMIGDPLLDLAYSGLINDLFASVEAKKSGDSETVLPFFKKEFNKLIQGYENARKSKLSEIELDQILKYKFLIYCQKYYWYIIHNDEGFIKIIERFLKSSYKNI